MISAVHTVIFDLDGTLLNTLGDLTAAVNFALASANLPPHSESEVRTFVGNGVEMIVRRACPPDIAQTEFQKIFLLFKSYYAEHSEVLTRPYDGIPKLLSELKQRNIAVGVASNKIDSVTKPLCRRFFGDLVDLACGERSDIPRKPDPTIIYYLLKELNADKGHTLYVGDSDVDMQTACSAGLRSVSCTWGFKDRNFLLSARERLLPDDYANDYLIDKPSDLLTFL